MFENLYYKAILNCVKDRREVAREIHEVWSSEFFRGDNRPRYFANAVKFLKPAKESLKIEERDLILWRQVVYCEGHGNAIIPKETYEKCISRHMRRFLSFVSGELVICFGEEAYKAVSGFREMRDAFDGRKVLGIYNPGGLAFYRYFEDYEKGILWKDVLDKLNEFLESYIYRHFGCSVTISRNSLLIKLLIEAEKLGLDDNQTFRGEAKSS